MSGHDPNPPAAPKGADYGKPVRVKGLAQVPLYYRSKGTSVPNFEEARRYYAGMLQIAYVHMGHTQCVAHVVDNLKVETRYQCKDDKEVHELLVRLLEGECK